MWNLWSPEMLGIFGRPHFEMMNQRWLGGMHSWMVNASTCLLNHLLFYNWTLQESDMSRQEGEGVAANHVKIVKYFEVVIRSRLLAFAQTHH